MTEVCSHRVKASLIKNSNLWPDAVPIFSTGFL